MPQTFTAVLDTLSWRRKHLREVLGSPPDQPFFLCPGCCHSIHTLFYSHPTKKPMFQLLQFKGISITAVGIWGSSVLTKTLESIVNDCKDSAKKNTDWHTKKQISNSHPYASKLSHEGIASLWAGAHKKLQSSYWTEKIKKLCGYFKKNDPVFTCVRHLWL